MRSRRDHGKLTTLSYNQFLPSVRGSISQEIRRKFLHIQADTKKDYTRVVVFVVFVLLQTKKEECQAIVL